MSSRVIAETATPLVSHGQDYHHQESRNQTHETSTIERSHHRSNRRRAKATSILAAVIKRNENPQLLSALKTAISNSGNEPKAAFIAASKALGVLRACSQAQLLAVTRTLENSLPPSEQEAFSKIKVLLSHFPRSRETRTSKRTEEKDRDDPETTTRSVLTQDKDDTPDVPPTDDFFSPSASIISLLKRHFLVETLVAPIHDVVYLYHARLHPTTVHSSVLETSRVKPEAMQQFWKNVLKTGSKKRIEFAQFADRLLGSGSWRCLLRFILGFQLPNRTFALRLTLDSPEMIVEVGETLLNPPDFAFLHLLAGKSASLRALRDDPQRPLPA